MDTRLLRALIYIFSGLIVVFSLLMLVNYFGSLAGARLDLPGQEAADKKETSASALAQEALAAAKYGAGAGGSIIPSYRRGLSTAAVRTDGAIMLVKERSFDGVAEAPKDLMAVLSEMSGGDKSKPAPIAMDEADLDKKITVEGVAGKEARRPAAAMPELGRQPGREGVTLFSAPVDYKVFRSSEAWWAFANSHKCRQATPEISKAGGPFSPIYKPDFSREHVLVLISVSELPNGIFTVTKLDRLGALLVVGYKVDPLAMAEGAENARHDFYSAAVIPKGVPLKLRQMP